MHPLDIKIVQKAIHIVLECIIEPTFSSTFQGLRPYRSTNSALKTIYLQEGNFNIAINGNISQCFKSIPQNVIMSILKKTIKCHHILELIHKSLKVASIFNERKLKYTGLGNRKVVS